MLYFQRIGERTYGERDPCMSPVYCVVGDCYLDTGTVCSRCERYRAALEVVEDKLGKNDRALVLPLRSLARSYVQEVYFYLAGGYLPMEQRGQMDAALMEPKGI